MTSGKGHNVKLLENRMIKRKYLDLHDIIKYKKKFDEMRSL
jgi:hypothetical protein